MQKIQKVLFYLILLIFPFGQLFRLNLSRIIYGLRIHPIDFAVFFFVLFWFLGKLIKKERFALPLFSKELLVFCFMATVSLFLQIGRINFSEFLEAFFYLLRLLNFVVLFLALTDFFKSERLDISSYLIGEGIVISFFSLIQYILLPDTRFLFNFGWDKHYFRAVGTFLDPAFTGVILTLAFIVWAVNFLDKNYRKSLLFWLAGFLLLLTVGLTFSRIAYVSLVAGLLAIFMLKRNTLFYLVFCLAFLGIIALIPKPGGEGVNLLRTSSFLARADSYKQSLLIIKDHFLFGVGFNTYRFVQRDYGFIPQSDWRDTNAGAGTDNSFLFVLATTGLFGLLVFLYFWIKLLYLSFVFSAKHANSLILFASLVVITFSSLAINAVFYAWIMVWLTILLANFMADKLSATRVLSYFGLGPNKQS